MSTNNITGTPVNEQPDGTLKAVPGWVLCSVSAKLISLCPLAKRGHTTSEHHKLLLLVIEHTSLCHLITGIRQLSSHQLPTTKCRVYSLRTDVHNSSWMMVETATIPGPHCGIYFCRLSQVIKTPGALQGTRSGWLSVLPTERMTTEYSAVSNHINVCLSKMGSRAGEMSHLVKYWSKCETWVQIHRTHIKIPMNSGVHL